MPLIFKEVMTDEADDETVSEEIGPVESGNVNEQTWYIVGSAGVASGAVQIEEAHVAGYAGTWAPNGSPITVAASTVKTVKVTGVSHVCRARISTAIGSGTVSVFVAMR